MKDETRRNDISMEQIIKEAEQEVMLLCSNTGKAYIKVSREKAASQLIPVDSETFEEWFRAYCYDKYGRIREECGSN